MISRPIFIIGAPRSGTSILTWALGQHSNIQPLEETNWIAHLGVSLGKVWKLGTCNKNFSHLGSLGWSEDNFYQIIGQKVNEIIVESLIDQVIHRHYKSCGPTNHQQKVEYGSKSKEFAFSLNDENSKLKILRSPNDPKKRWIDGTPENTFYAYTLLRLFPNARFIHLLRHPDDVCASLMNFAKVGGGATNFSVESSYINWTRYVSSAYLLEKALGRDSICRIRFEDMIKSPVMVIKDILTWLGEEFEKTCIEPFGEKINSSKVNSFEIKPSDLRDNSLSLLSEILQYDVGVPDPSARKELIANDEKIINIFTNKKTESVVNIEDWGPRETNEKTRFNIQHAGVSAIWVKAHGLSKNAETHVLFDGKKISNSDIDSDNNLFSFYVRDELIEKSGNYEIRIITGNLTNEIKLGTFVVKPISESKKINSFQNIKTTCRNCGSFCNFYSIYNDEKILKCSKCRAYQWVGSVPSFAKLYTQDYFNGDEYVAYEKSAKIYRLNLDRKLQTVLRSPYFDNKTPEDYLNERIFELGSATGEFLKILHKRKFTKLLGSEISSFCREVAEQNGFQLLNPLSEDHMKSIKAFNPTILCAWDVWEHLEIPYSIFNDILKFNQDIKLVALSTVDSGASIPRIKGKRWRQFHPPTHMNYPTRKSFKTFFESIGFSVKILKSFGYYRPLADYLSVFLGRKTVSLFPFLFKIPLYLNLYDIQIIVAERKK